MMMKKIIGISSVIYMLLITSTGQTYSWFTSDVSTEGTITNATTESLIDIGNPNVDYKEGFVQIAIPITNISSLSIPISVDDVEMIVHSYDTNIFTVEKEITEEMNSIGVKLIGFDYFIDEEIIIPLDSTQFITSGAAITLK